MNTPSLPSLRAMEYELDTSPEHFGCYRDSQNIIHDGPALRQRMEDDGYLYIRGLLNRDDVLEARHNILGRLSADGFSDRNFSVDEGVCAPDKEIGWGPQYAENNPALDRVVFGHDLISFYAKMMGEPVRHYDYKWFRPCSTGINGAPPHCDIVYMGRGTHRVYTAWIPYGEISLEMGPLMILEGSYQNRHKLANYLKRDVDTYCSNYADGPDIASGKKGWHWPGWLSNNPFSLREKFGGRWLAGEFQPGDFLTFSIETIHAFLDNQTPHMRLTSDTRYQRASEPIDERWVGEKPIAHGLAGKRGKIC